MLHGLTGHVGAVLSQILIVATLVLGVYEIQAGTMSIGALSAALMLVGRTSTPVAVLMAQGFRLRQAAFVTAGLRTLMDAEPERAGDAAAAPREIRGLIELSGISFSYPDESRASLDSVAFRLEPGERVGIIGRAGCGKSTLLKQLTRLHDAQKGAFLIDGRDARQFDPVALRAPST